MNTHSARYWLRGPLAIEPMALDLLLKCSSEDLERMQAAHELARSAQAQRRLARVSVVPILGFMGYHNWLAAMIGTATERVIASVREASNDPDTDAIVLWVDSPGGEVRGIEELVAEIRRARGMKAVIGAVDAMAGSAAYWVASQTDSLLVTPSGEAGSIGVFVQHIDASAAYEREGLRPTFIGSTASPYKTETADTGPLSDDTRAYLQRQVDSVAQQFIAAVATGRKTTQRAVRETFGGGRMVAASEAVRVGMADKIGTLEDALSFAATRAKKAVSATAGAVAAADELEIHVHDDVALITAAEARELENVGLDLAATDDMTALVETPVAVSEPDTAPEPANDTDYRRTRLAIAERRQAR